MENSSTELSEDSPFSYECTRCSQCCIKKIIHVNPYEILRLARNQNVSIKEFKEKFTNEGTSLKQKEDYSCVFLGEKGCSVHPDRPLVCRVFPLGRFVESGGRAYYSLGDWNPKPNGTYGKNGKVRDYIEGQGLPIFSQMADMYFKWYVQAVNVFGSAGPESDELQNVDDILDIDEAVDAYCRLYGLKIPQNAEEKTRLHIKILEEMLEN